MTHIKRNKRGFSLVEMMLALAIITIIGWTTVALMIAIKNSFMTTYNTNDSADYAVLYANGFENAFLAHTQNNKDGEFFINPTGSILMQESSVKVFSPGQMKTTNLATNTVVDKWNIRIFFKYSTTDASQLVKYRIYILDNYYSPNRVMTMYEGSVWAPHMGMNRISYNDGAHSPDSIESQIRSSYPELDSDGWHNNIVYTHYT